MRKEAEPLFFTLLAENNSLKTATDYWLPAWYTSLQKVCFITEMRFFGLSLRVFCGGLDFFLIKVIQTGRIKHSDEKQNLYL